MAERTGADDLGPPTAPAEAPVGPAEAPTGPAEAPTGPAEATADPAPAVGVPESVGPYRITGRLGAGGMGTVFLGRRGDGPPVAVKVLRAELARDPSFLRMFRHEVAAARRVVGFCTARLLDADVNGPTPYLVTEYVEGVRLDRAVAGSGRLSATDLEGLAVGMAAALTAIHGAGVVHRDLKPSNVLLSYFGPKVIDFGIARALDATTAASSRLMGTPSWMAPEQFAEGEVTAAVDVFSWGSLVAYAGTGRRPFGQGNVVELAYRITHEPPDLEGLDGRLREVVEACMAKDPERRPAARAVLLDLLGDRATPDPQADATSLLERTWVPPPAAPSQASRPAAASQVGPATTPPSKLAGAAEPQAERADGPIVLAAAGRDGTTSLPAAAGPGAPAGPASPAPRPRSRRVGRRLALAGVVVAVVAGAAAARLYGWPDGNSGTAPTTTAAATGGTGKVAAPAPPLLCELLGDLGVGRALRARPADQLFATSAEAAGFWLPDPTALPRALDAHRFSGGCTRTWTAERRGPVVAALFQFPSRAEALAMRGALRDSLGAGGVRPDRLPEVTGGELYRLERGGGSGQLVMFVCNDRVLQIHAGAGETTLDPLPVRLGQGANRRLHERTGCPL